MRIAQFQNDILSWYKAHQRTLPWRTNTQNPYHTWVSEIMLQQTTVPAVIPYFERFLEKWPTVWDLAIASLDDVLHLWQGLGYYSRARNLHQCAKKIADDFQGIFPSDEGLLKTLPGIGDYTAAAIRSIAFNKPSVVIDGNIERIISRLFLIKTPLPASKPLIKKQAALLISKKEPGHYAQALMDLGSLICTPTNPKCTKCPIERHCKAKNQMPENYPKRLEKQKKSERFGTLFWIENKQGEVLIEKRPEKGLLGGLMGFPTSPWESKETQIQGSMFITHTFTHFHLTLKIQKRRASKNHEGLWVKKEDFHRYAFPTLMKKAIKAMHQDDTSSAATGA